MKIKVDGAGKKDDFKDKKIRLELVPPNFTNAIGRVLTYGAEKYAAHNWMRGMDFSRLIGAIKRHLESVEFSEDFDEETQEQHLAHIGCCVAFLHYFIEHKSEYEAFDDRVFTRGEVHSDATRPTFLGVLNEHDVRKKTSSGRQQSKKKAKATKKSKKTR